MSAAPSPLVCSPSLSARRSRGRIGWAPTAASHRWRRHSVRLGRRSFGYALFGKSPISPNAILPRGQRISSLCAMDHKGMVDWSHTKGTFKKRNFLRAWQASIIPLDQLRSERM